MTIGKRDELLMELSRLNESKVLRHTIPRSQRIDVADYVNRALGGLPPETRLIKSVGTQTGVVSLDLALGGGLPSGLVELYGEESSGKTALVGSTVARSQRLGMWTMLCSSEFLDLPYLERLGVALDKLIVVRGPLEGIRAVVEPFVAKTGRLAVIDSLSALRPREESVGAWNRAVYEFLQLKVAHQSCLLVTNQVRARRSMEKRSGLTSGTESAARWIHDLYDARLELQRSEVHEDSYTMIASIVANRLARPSVWVELPVIKGHGVDVNLDRLRAAVRMGIVSKKGPRYYVGFFHLGLGEREAADELVLNDEVHDMVMERLVKAAIR